VRVDDLLIKVDKDLPIVGNLRDYRLKWNCNALRILNDLHRDSLNDLLRRLRLSRWYQVQLVDAKRVVRRRDFKLLRDCIEAHEVKAGVLLEHHIRITSKTSEVRGPVVSGGLALGVDSEVNLRQLDTRRKNVFDIILTLNCQDDVEVGFESADWACDFY